MSTSQDPSKSESSRRVEGWAAIASCISAHTGFKVSVAAVQRYSRWEKDALPVMRWGRGRRHVVADAGALGAWCSRQWSGR